MTDQTPTAPGWYPDPNTRGQLYWDGARWTGDVKPPRKAFAAEHKYEGVVLEILGILAIGLGVTPFLAGVPPLGQLVPIIAGLAGYGLLALYLLRGRGPSTEAVQARLAAERREANEAAERAAKIRRRKSFFGINVEAPDVAGAAQVNAVANTATAEALQNLQNLLFTKAISDAEFQAAKSKLFGSASSSSSVEHIAKLVELHQAGVLTDYEFAAAKAKALGI